MTLERAHPMGWALFELLTSGQINKIDEQLPLAVDGRGGAYTLQQSLEFDGLFLTTTPSIRLSGGGEAPTLDVSQSGTGSGVHVYSQDPNGTSPAMRVWSAECDTADSITEMLRIEGRQNNGGDGGQGASVSGGDAVFLGSTGGIGAVISGGSNYDHGPGGRAAIFIGGRSNFGADATPKLGLAAVWARAGDMDGGAATQHASAAIQAEGGHANTNGRGGAGVFAIGGLGSSNGYGQTDMGPGVVGAGSVGVLGIVTGEDPDYRPLPAEFSQNARAGVRAAGKTVGRALVSEFSGTAVGQEPEANLFALVGTVGASAGKQIVSIQSNPAAATPSSAPVTGLFITSNANNTSFRGASVSGRQDAALSLTAFGGLSNVNLHMPLYLIPTNTAPTKYVAGEVGMLGPGAVAGLSGGLFAAVQGSASIDRVVTSGDSAAAWAWARIRTDGAGGVALVSDYGCTGVAFNGDFSIVLTLESIAGEPANADNMVAVATQNYQSGLGAGFKTGFAIAALTDATHVNVQAWDPSGTAIDLTASKVEISVLVHAMPAYGRAATRPTFYRP